VNPQDLNTTGTSLPLDTDGKPDEKMAMPIGVGDMEEGPNLDPLAEARNAKKLSGGSMVIIIVVLIAASGLFFMRRLSQVTATTSMPQEIEETINKFLNAPGHGNGAGDAEDFDAVNSQKSVLEVLTAAYSERQVPLKDVQRDPFEIYATPVKIDNTDHGPVIDESAALSRRQAERRQNLTATAKRLELKSVLGGSNPLANIGGRIYRVGESVPVGSEGQKFRVIDISNSSVILVAEVPELGMTRAMGNAVEVTLDVHAKR
jgi:hypothetical protein